MLTLFHTFPLITGEYQLKVYFKKKIFTKAKFITLGDLTKSEHDKVNSFIQLANKMIQEVN